MKLNRLIAPILVHTAEEIRSKLNPGDGLPSVFAEQFDVPTEDRLTQIEGSRLQTRFAALLEVRSEAFAAYEAWNVENGEKDSQKAVLSLSTESDEVLTFTAEELANYFKMSWVEVRKGPVSYTFRKSEFLQCARCRLLRPDVEMVGDVPLAKRCQEVLKHIGA